MDSTSSSAAPPPSFYIDNKWKLSKKENSSSSLTATTTPTSKRCAFTRKCAKLVKEQRARFYIMRRCVIMLICWRDYTDS
ncbi:peptidyl-prolyl cis-trans isomerase FKBP20-1-like isoform X1 [Hibiscus syriacus]|uniref:Peptidyl-prolyl cis-trans isomerase FKBP20-1-like isoform X1 n=1 Tax=Hibiscus syriacus TaxID=106335 RepID=A0A6A3BQ82_HIBSY|nr:peptidyl-prolyl cis-trans isomerase FKBP20-1-like isoform X1 [Hibiscus syriacus]